MAIQNITYTDKVDLDETQIADINKVKASDLNEIKTVVNNNATEMVDTYSTTETKLNKKWVDGKDIYRTCFYIASFPNNNEMNVDTTSLNIEYLVNLYGFAKALNGNNGFPVNGARPENPGNTIGAYMAPNALRIVTSVDRSAYSGYVILEYTKTS